MESKDEKAVDSMIITAQLRNHFFDNIFLFALGSLFMYLKIVSKTIHKTAKAKIYI